MTEDIRVPVKTSLRPAEYRWLDAIAREHRTTVASLVGEIIRRAHNTRDIVAPVQRSKHARLTEQDREQIRELYDRGWSDPRIAKHFQCSPQTVSNHRAAMGLAPHYSGRPKKEKSA